MAVFTIRENTMVNMEYSLVQIGSANRAHKINGGVSIRIQEMETSGFSNFRAEMPD